MDMVRKSDIESDITEIKITVGRMDERLKNMEAAILLLRKDESDVAEAIQKADLAIKLSLTGMGVGGVTIGKLFGLI